MQGNLRTASSPLAVLLQHSHLSASLGVPRAATTAHQMSWCSDTPAAGHGWPRFTTLLVEINRSHLQLQSIPHPLGVPVPVQGLPFQLALGDTRPAPHSALTEHQPHSCSCWCQSSPLWRPPVKCSALYFCLQRVLERAQLSSTPVLIKIL